MDKGRGFVERAGREDGDVVYPRSPVVVDASGSEGSELECR
jgi:hypothetical protein